MLGSNDTSTHYALIAIHAKHTWLLPAAQISVRESSPTNLSIGPLNTTPFLFFFTASPKSVRINQITFPHCTSRPGSRVAASITRGRNNLFVFREHWYYCQRITISHNWSTQEQGK